jgi:hypothetical protein
MKETPLQEIHRLLAEIKKENDSKTDEQKMQEWLDKHTK